MNIDMYIYIRWLAEARERLKERYLPGSVDGEGEGSFPYPSPPVGFEVYVYICVYTFAYV